MTDLIINGKKYIFRVSLPSHFSSAMRAGTRSTASKTVKLRPNSPSSAMPPKARSQTSTSSFAKKQLEELRVIIREDRVDKEFAVVLQDVASHGSTYRLLIAHPDPADKEGNFSVRSYSQGTPEDIGNPYKTVYPQ